MMKFEYKFSNNSPVISVSLSPESTLTQTLEAFESFLRAVGYSFDGEVTITEDAEVI